MRDRLKATSEEKSSKPLTSLTQASLDKQFLHQMQSSTQERSEIPTPAEPILHSTPHSLDIAILGCGLGGLAAAYTLGRWGHRVTVYEQAPAIGEVGAGIQAAPNVSRLLIRWGMGEKLKQCGVTPKGVTFRRYQDGERIGWSKLGDKFDREYGAPYYHVHRADLFDMLHDAGKPHMKLRLDSRVVALDPTLGTFTLATGEVVGADLIIGADGLRSVVREAVLNRQDTATPTGDAAYRAIIPTSEMMKDPDLKKLVEETEMTAWLGPGRHIMAYNIRAKKEFNVVMLHPDNDAQESWTDAASLEQMRRDFEGWEPTVQKLLALIPVTMNGKLMGRPPLERWVHPDGKVVLLGDSCHPMLPYRAQGAAMAIEDAAVLGGLLSRLNHPSQLHYLLQSYQNIRYERATETQLASRINQYSYHLSDGKEQETRDANMRAAMEIALKTADEEVPAGSGNPNMWGDKERNDRQYHYDAEAEAAKWWMQQIASSRQSRL